MANEYDLSRKHTINRTPRRQRAQGRLTRRSRRTFHMLGRFRYGFQQRITTQIPLIIWLLPYTRCNRSSLQHIRRNARNRFIRPRGGFRLR